MVVSIVFGTLQGVYPPVISQFRLTWTYPGDWPHDFFFQGQRFPHRLGIRFSLSLFWVCLVIVPIPSLAIPCGISPFSLCISSSSPTLVHSSAPACGPNGLARTDRR